jgi:prefoldin subunit 5
MSEELREIQRGVASLKKDLEKLRRLQSDCDEVKKLRKRLVGTEFD